MRCVKRLSVILVLAAIGVQAQQYAVDKGALWISGAASLSSHKYDEADNGTTTLVLAPMVNYFLAPNIFLGVGANLTRVSHGQSSSTDIGIGPQAGYAVGSRSSSTFPFVSLGYRFLSQKEKYESNAAFLKATGTGEANASGNVIYISGGVVHAMKKNLGVTVEVSYRMQSQKWEGADESTKSKTLSVGLGLVGFVF